jgi:hypothetical protein
VDTRARGSRIAAVDQPPVPVRYPPVTTYEWLLFLHLLAAFAMVAGVVLFLSLLLGAGRAPDAPEGLPLRRISRLAGILWNLGGISVLVFGVWLALHLDAYEITDGWVLAAIALWVVAAAAGGPVAVAYSRALAPDEGTGGAAVAAEVRSQRMIALHGLMTVAVAALLFVMIYKPGV